MAICTLLAATIIPLGKYRSVNPRTGRHGFRKLLEIGGVDAVMPDLQKCGGLGEGQRIANLANLYYIPFAPHMVASFLGAMACAHVCDRCRMTYFGELIYEDT